MADHERGWYIVAKTKRLTVREKQERAAFKKRMQDKGVLPPDKPKLNRKKFIEEAKDEWYNREEGCAIWDQYLMEALFFMLGHFDKKDLRLSREAVGAAKVLKLAIRLRKFSKELQAKGVHEYKLADKCNYIKDIFDA